MNASDLVLNICERNTSAKAIVSSSLDRIKLTDGRVNAFTEVFETRALAKAAQIDSIDVAERKRYPLLGVPFAVKNLFDVKGVATLAGSKIERQASPASEDALLVRRLEAAGAVLVGALNMDEYAYGFTTENTHQGPTRNPHDLTRIAGGSSGGSAAAVAASQVTFTLGSDTNGSIRVPSSLCGVFGLKPTFGRLPRTGTYPFVSSLDHLGPFARSTRDLAMIYDVMQGPEDRTSAFDIGCAQREVEPTVASLDSGVRGLRIGVLGGYFSRNATTQAREAVQAVAQALSSLDVAGIDFDVELPMVEAGRAAAFLISNSEGAALHLHDLRVRANDFEPLSRDRFLAGALLPAAWVARAQRVRQVYASKVAELMQRYDILIAPSTPCSATTIGQESFEIDGKTLPVRPNMGLLTQPFSCIGLPVCSVPVFSTKYPMPIGVQIIGAPWREDMVLRVSHHLENAGAVKSVMASID